VGEGAYRFPKPSGVRAWFKALLGEGILWVEGNIFPNITYWPYLTVLPEGKEAHEKQRRVLSPALKYSCRYIVTPRTKNIFI
jgi:hypothetical protein